MKVPEYDVPYASSWRKTEMGTRPRLLIEEWLPVTELGIESRREAAPIPGQFPKIKTLHVWWARRPLAASAGAILGSVMPAWSVEFKLEFPSAEELSSERAYRSWFLRLCGIHGDPIAAKVRIAAATEQGVVLGAAAYGYKQAFKNSPSSNDLALLHQLLVRTWGGLPVVIDPTAGGGSIPYEAIRYGLPTIANDLNPIAASVLRAGVELPARFGTKLTADIKRLGTTLVESVHDRLREYFPIPDRSDNNTYIFARSVLCPRTKKPVPLAPNWWLAKEKGGVAARLVTERNGEQLDLPEFEIAKGKAIDFDPDDGTVARGDALSPWDGLAISGDYIKAEAQAGRMGSILYAVAVRVDGARDFRAPTTTDFAALASAETELDRLRPEWEANDILPKELVPEGNDNRPHHYGMSRWRDMFSPRQLLVHGTFVDEYRKLVLHSDEGPDPSRTRAALGILGLMVGKGIDWNGRLATWDPTRNKVGHVFQRHDFAFVWSHTEFEGARELYPWVLRQVTDSYQGIAELLLPSDAANPQAIELDYPMPGNVTVLSANAGNLQGVVTGSLTSVIIDPPYYDNVMYAELSDYFYVWEKRTLGLVWPEFFQEELTDKKNEAVANPARFNEAGRRRKELATADYEAKMTAIFEECHRVLRDDGVLTVMFTHKKAEAWDTLGMALMDAGFTIETSWPVPTESEVSLHQAKKNAAQSTIFLVCRKRESSKESSIFYEDIEADVRTAAREALQRFRTFGIDGVDLLLSTYGPALSVISSHWPVFSSKADPVTGKNRPLRPEQALATARQEVVRLQRERLIGKSAMLDTLTDFTLLAWETFRAREFPYDEARRLALAVGGIDVETLVRAKLLTKKSGTVVLLEPGQRLRRRSDADGQLPGVRLDATSFEHLVDAVHTALHLTQQDGPSVAKQFLEKLGLIQDLRFLAAVQGFINAIPRTRQKGKWAVLEAGLLDELAVFLESITVPTPVDEVEPVVQDGIGFNGDEDEESED